MGLIFLLNWKIQGLQLTKGLHTCWCWWPSCLLTSFTHSTHLPTTSFKLLLSMNLEKHGLGTEFIALFWIQLSVTQRIILFFFFFFYKFWVGGDFVYVFDKLIGGIVAIIRLSLYCFFSFSSHFLGVLCQCIFNFWKVVSWI